MFDSIDDTVLVKKVIVSVSTTTMCMSCDELNKAMAYSVIFSSGIFKAPIGQNFPLIKTLNC